MSLGEVWVTLCFDFLGEVFRDSEGLKWLAFLLFPGNGWGCGLALFGGWEVDLFVILGLV